MIVADFQTLNEGKFCQSNNYQELKNPSNMARLNIIKNFSFSEHSKNYHTHYVTIIKMAEILLILLQIYSLRHFILHKNVARIERHCFVSLHRILHLGKCKNFFPANMRLQF